MDVSASARSSAPATSASQTATSTSRSASAGPAPRPGGGRERGAGGPFASLLAAARGRAGTKAALPLGPAKDAGTVLEDARTGLDGTARKHGKRNGEAGGDEDEETAAGVHAAAAPGEGNDDEATRARSAARDDSDWLDPSARQAAQLAPPAGLAHAAETASTQSGEPVRARSLEELLPALVKRIAWAGDRHKGTVRLELGAGAYAGTTVVVHAEGGRVRVEIGGHEGPELDRLRARLDTRLRGHGLDVDSVT